MPPRFNPRNPYRSRNRSRSNTKTPRRKPLLDLLRGAKKTKTRFDPEGSGYDYDTAKRSGLGPDNKGKWPSRVPSTGQILKGASHKTYGETKQGESDAGYQIRKDPLSGKRYSDPVEGVGKGWRARGATQEERAKSYAKEDLPVADLGGSMCADSESWLTGGGAIRGDTAPQSTFDDPFARKLTPDKFLKASDDLAEKLKRIDTAKREGKAPKDTLTVGDKRAIRLHAARKDARDRKQAQADRDARTRDTYSGAQQTIQQQREAAQRRYDENFEGGLGAAAAQEAKMRDERRKAQQKKARDKADARREKN